MQHVKVTIEDAVFNVAIDLETNFIDLVSSRKCPDYMDYFRLKQKAFDLAKEAALNGQTEVHVEHS